MIHIYLSSRWCALPIFQNLFGKMSRAGLLVLLLVVSPLPFSALYVHVSQGRMKCFIEYWEEHTVVLVTYRSPDQAPLPREQEVYIYVHPSVFMSLICIYVHPSVPLMRF